MKRDPVRGPFLVEKIRENEGDKEWGDQRTSSNLILDTVRQL